MSKISRAQIQLSRARVRVCVQRSTLNRNLRIQLSISRIVPLLSGFARRPLYLRPERRSDAAPWRAARAQSERGIIASGRRATPETITPLQSVVASLDRLAPVPQKLIGPTGPEVFCKPSCGSLDESRAIRRLKSYVPWQGAQLPVARRCTRTFGFPQVGAPHVQPRTVEPARAR